SADNLVPNDTNGLSDIFLKDLTTGAITRVSVGTLDEQGSPSTASRPQGSHNAVFSPDGTLVAFDSDDIGLTADTPALNGNSQVYVKNLSTGVLNLESQLVENQTHIVGNAPSITPSFSPDGTMLTFASFARNFPGVSPTNNAYQIYVKNLADQ